MIWIMFVARLTFHQVNLMCWMLSLKRNKLDKMEFKRKLFSHFKSVCLVMYVFENKDWRELQEIRAAKGCSPGFKNCLFGYCKKCRVTNHADGGCCEMFVNKKKCGFCVWFRLSKRNKKISMKINITRKCETISKVFLFEIASSKYLGQFSLSIFVEARFFLQQILHDSF